MNELRNDRVLAGNFDMYMNKFGKDHNPDSKGKVDALSIHKPTIIKRIAKKMQLEGMFESYDEARDYVEKKLFIDLEHRWHTEGPFDLETLKQKTQSKKETSKKGADEWPLSEVMNDFYSDKLFNEDAIGDMSNDDAVDLYIIDVLNPNLSDNSPQKAREDLREALKKVSDAKLHELWLEYGDKPGARLMGKLERIEQLNRTVFSIIDDERVARLGKPAKNNASKLVNPLKNPVKSEDTIGGVFAGGVQADGSKVSGDSFAERQRKAVADKGTVAPGLAAMEVKVVDVPRHDFAGSASDVIKQAKKWAMDNIRGTYAWMPNSGKSFNFMINRESINKYLDGSSWKNSANLGVHVAVLKKLPEVISNSLLSESHPDRNRGVDGKVRSRDSINESGLIHRLYGAVRIEEADGTVKMYRVKTTLRENNNSENGPNAHNYEVTEIELIEASRADAQMSDHASMTMTSISSITGAKLLKGVEKSYEPGKKLLDESAKVAGESGEESLSLPGTNLNDRNDEKKTDLRVGSGAAEREDGHESGQNEPLGTSKRNKAARPKRGGVAGRSGEHTVSDSGGGSRISGQHPSGTGVSAAPKNTRNNRAERGVDYAPKSEKARIEANIAAIELAKQLQASGATATAEEMAVLRKYSGWGGLGAAFKEGSPWSPNPLNKRLREVLTPEEYEAANMSRNSAYFTPAGVIDNLWDIARALGFKGGNVLEGSAGIGNIIGLMPAELSERSNIHAVEIDPMTGGMLSLLYPDAKVEVQGFEKTRIGNGTVDLAITNVPFVTGLHVMDESGDKDLSKKFRDIHDFCIAKNVRKLREGGIGIFITSSGTLDKSHKLREWLVNEKGGCSDVVGVFRMHNKTFGGTAATSDIIVVRKRVNGRKSANAIDVSTVSAARTATYVDENGKTKELPLLMNRYFIEHPEAMGGEMFFGFERKDTYRPTSTGLYEGDANQAERMATWVESLAGKDWTDDKVSVEPDAATRINEVLGEGVKEGNMVLDSEGNLCVARAGVAVPLGINTNRIKGRSKQECFKDYSDIKSAVADVLQYQTEHADDAGLQPLLDRLNRAYDTFVERYGNLNKNKNLAWLRNDVDFASIVALETYSEKGTKDGKKVQTFGKTDIFSRRVVEMESEPAPKNVKDGIIASLYKHGRIDMEYLSEQLGKSQSDLKQEIVESGLGFENPTTGQMEVVYEYLSGNVRAKLREAREANEANGGIYDANVKALEGVVPMNIPSHLIEFTLGSSWIEPQLYERFVKERTDLDVKLTNVGGTWYMDEPYSINKPKNKEMGVRSEMFDILIPGHKLIEAALTNKTITVSKTFKDSRGNSFTEKDPSATIACATKIDEIRQEFRDWAREQMKADPEMSMRIEEIYNDQFNNSVPKLIPEEFVPEHFGGAATMVEGKPFKLRPHQGKAVVRATTQPVLLAHEVGTGKTYTLITAAMEMRRLGTARKPMIVVQNATVGQFVASAKALYPNAKVLTINEEDRTKEGRKAFYAKIKYNDWDMIVVPQSVLEMIPDSVERQTRFIEDKIEEKVRVLEQMKAADPSGRNPIVRAAQREIDKLHDEIAQLASGRGNRGAASETDKDAKKEAVTRQNTKVKAQEMLDRATDDVEDFDSMGIDALLVDEAHEYKHLGFPTAMQRGVKGIDPSYSKKSQGVYLKAQAVLEKTGGKNVVFATGTPISNTAAEIWTFMRYLMPADEMKEYGIYYFDDFVRNFGNLQQMLEFKTNGKYEEVNRFAGYINLPELVRIWSTVADTVLTREAGGVSDKIPAMEGDKAQDIFLPQTRALRSIMKYVKEQLAAYEEMSGKEKKEKSHIPLVMYGIAQAAAVDARLVQADAEDDPNSKTNEAVRQTLRSLEETKEYNGTVAIFADKYQNKTSGFNLYEDIRNKLIAAGVPAEQVVVMKSGMSVKKKLEIFDKVNSGEVRVILGSTYTLGTGVNIQERLHTLIHVDAPNRPMDYTQRNGRILRQGNLHKDWGIPVRVLRFGVEDSLDVTAYQRLKTKGAIADSIMDGKTLMANSMENRTMEEDQDLFGDITAQLSGSEYAMLKNQLEKEVRKLTAKLKQWEADQAYIHNRKREIAGQNREAAQSITRAEEYLAKIESPPVNGISVGGKSYSDIGAMGDFFTEQNKKKNEVQERVRKAGYYGSSGQIDVTVNVGGFDFDIHTKVILETKNGGDGLFASASAKMTYSCAELGIESTPVSGNLIKNAVIDIVENVMTGNDLRERIEAKEQRIASNNAELESMAARDGVPFKFGDDLAKALEKLDEYEELMKAEMEAKEAKYAEVDSSVEAATGVELSQEDEEESEDDVKYREGEDVIEELFNRAVSGELSGKPVSVGRLTAEGREYLERLSGMNFRRETIDFMLNPSDLVHIYRDHYGANEKDPGNNIPLTVEDVREIASVISQPEAVVYGVEPDGLCRKIFYFLSSAGNGAYNLAEVYSDKKGNLTAKTFYKTKKGVAQRVLFLKQSEHLTSVTDGSALDNGAKLPIFFESTTLAAQENSAELEREGHGAVSDAEVSMENDLISRVNGKLRFGPKKRAEFAARERQRMRQRAEDLVKKLNLSNVDIVEDGSGLSGKKARAKGFFDPRTGRITVVLANNLGAMDVERTILHEAVAHYGLRKLLGEAFTTFLDNVYECADESIRREIAAMAARNGWDFRTATEEYLAKLAENTDFEADGGWWHQIKRLFMAALDRIGLLSFRDAEVVITDNELRYMLWQSYYNLKHPGSVRGYMAEADRIVKESELGVGNFAPTVQEVAEANAAFRKEVAGLEGRSEVADSGAMGKVWSVSDKLISLFEQAIKGDIKGKPIAIGNLTKEGRDYLCSLSEMELKENVQFVVNPSDLVHIYKRHFGTNEKDGRNIPLTIADIEHMSEIVMNPDRVIFAKELEGQRRNLFFFLKESANGSYNLLEVYADRHGNLTSKSFFKSKEGVSQRVISLQNDPTLYVRDGWGNPLDGTKLPTFFENPTMGAEESGDGGVLFRMPEGTARASYDKMVATRRKGDPSDKRADKAANYGHRLKEAYLDSMQSLNDLQKAVAEESGLDIEDHENAYMAENQMSSRNKNAEEVFLNKFFQPIVDAVSQVIKAEREATQKAGQKFAGEKAAYEALTRYMIAKHGLERNAWMRAKAVDEANNADYSKRKDPDAARDAAVKRAMEADYSGLTGLTGKDSVADAEAEAAAMVAAYEGAHRPAALAVAWGRVKAATEWTLRKRYESGLISREVYEEVRGRYRYYIPLKGWAETTAEDLYDYAPDGHGLGSAFKSAHGRVSVADDPLATISVDAQRTIMEANRNVMKSRLLNLALNHNVDLLHVAPQWYQVDANGEWEPVNPQLTDDMTADEIADAIKLFEADMLVLEAQGFAKRKWKGLTLNVKSVGIDRSQHVVRVQRNGETVCIYINGNPRAALAVNGRLNPDAGELSSMEQVAQNVKNYMAKAMTTWNPEFVVSNLCRDVIFAGSAVLVKENGKYAKRYTSNITGILAKAKLFGLLSKWEAGTLDMNNEVERLFKEFMTNGGETGFVQLNSVDKVKKQMQRLIHEAQGGGLSMAKKGWRGFWNGVEFMNRCAEDTTRFAVYMTSRQEGRSVQRSISDAKEITVNFNRKGSGAMGARTLNYAYVFFNAAMQAVANFCRLFKNHPVKASVMTGAFFGVGLLAPVAFIAMAALFGGDDTPDYFKLPEWVRRNNLVLYIPFTDKFLTIPLPHELRPFYGMGEIALSAMCGKEDVEAGLWKAAEGLTGMLPMDFTGHGGNMVANFAPTYVQPFVEIHENVDFFGQPIYRDNDWNKDAPEYEKAYKGTSPWLVDGSKWLYDTMSDNDEYGLQDGPKHWFTGDVNPAWIEHIVTGYTGGFGKTALGAGKLTSMLWNEDMRETRNVPILRKLVTSVDDKAKDRKLSSDYFALKDAQQESRKYLKRLRTEAPNDSATVATRVNKWLETPEGIRYMKVDGLVKGIERLSRASKDDTPLTEEKRLEIQQTADSLRRVAVAKSDSVTGAGKGGVEWLNRMRSNGGSSGK